MGREGGGVEESEWAATSDPRRVEKGRGGKEAAFRRGRVWEWAKADLMATTRGRGTEDGLGGGEKARRKEENFFFKKKRKRKGTRYLTKTL